MRCSRRRTCPTRLGRCRNRPHRSVRRACSSRRPSSGRFRAYRPSRTSWFRFRPCHLAAAAATAEPRSRLSLGVWAVIIAVVSVFRGRRVSRVRQVWRFAAEGLARQGSRPRRCCAGTVPALAVPHAGRGSQRSPPNRARSKLSVAEDGEQSIEGDEAPDRRAGARPSKARQLKARLTRRRASVEAVGRHACGRAAGSDGRWPEDGTGQPRKPRVRRAPRPKPAAAPAQGDSLSAADQKLLADFDSSANAAPAKIDVEKSGSTQSKKPPLDGDGVRATVTTNKPRLQRCYERAIRGQQSPPSVRLDVTVTVASSGRVKAVERCGQRARRPRGMRGSLRATVALPASSEGGPAKFPIVFSAN